MSAPTAPTTFELPLLAGTPAARTATEVLRDAQRERAASPGGDDVAERGALKHETTDGSVDHDALWRALSAVEDPELPVTVTDLGLVRRLEVADGAVRVGLTYTSLACPCTEILREDVAEAVAAVPGVREVVVDDVLESWSRDDVTPAGREMLRAVAVI